MSPAFYSAVTGYGIVPIANIVNISLGCETGARRHADWTIRTRPIETCPALRQCIEVRGFHQRMFGTAEHLRVMLVRHNHEQIFSAIAATYLLFFPTY